MVIPIPKAIAIVLGVTFFVGQAGCVDRLSFFEKFKARDIRAQWGTIGIVSAHYAPEVQLQMPAKGAGGGVVRGAQAGADGGFRVGAYPCTWKAEDPGCATFMLLGVVLAIPGTLVGSVYGAIAVEPAESVEEVEAAIRQVLAELKMQEALRDHVLQEARNQTRHTVVLLTEEGPTAPDKEGTYPAVGSEGVGTILEMSLQSVGFEGETAVNPPLAFFMTVRVRLIPVGDGSEYYDRAYYYKTSARPYTEWVVNDAQAFQEAVNLGYQNLAEQIVDALSVITVRN